MRAGGLDNEITIESQTETGRNDYNEPIVTWSAFFAGWAGIEVVRGKEHFADGKRFHQDVYRITVRREEVDGINARMRVVMGGQTLRIIHVRPGMGSQADTVIEAVLNDGTQADIT